MVFLFPKWNRLMKPEESDSSVYQIVAGWGAAPECPLWTHAAIFLQHFMRDIFKQAVWKF
ncbi:hypothetical protein B1222_01280 [Paenibacillus larvae subsp. pulvifaciens]|nr:hypothetical protein B1222_01280 [Paenibacillus larvae subsp. pulvifaciens]